MTSTTPTARAPRRFRPRAGLAVLLGALLIAAELGLAGTALAGSSSSLKFKSGGEGQGRIYDPSRLRTKKSGTAPGRVLRRPPVPEPENPRPLRSTARIPSPEPHTHGGSGYVRRGNRFYEVTEAPTLTRRSDQRIRATIPSPETHKRGRTSAATR
jgi:hypothetical protein